MRKFPVMMAGAGMLVALAACGSTDTQRATTGGLGGAAAGAVVGGPVGAVIGGAAGAGTGVAMDEGLGTKVENLTDGRSGSTVAQSGSRSGSAASARALSPQRVRNVQQALNDNGSDIGVDGVWGPNTRRALREFQQSRGLNATGQLDAETVAALNLDRQTGSAGQSGAGPRDAGAGASGGANTQGVTQGDTGAPGDTGQPARQ